MPSNKPSFPKVPPQGASIFKSFALSLSSASLFGLFANNNNNNNDDDNNNNSSHRFRSTYYCLPHVSELYVKPLRSLKRSNVTICFHCKNHIHLTSHALVVQKCISKHVVPMFCPLYYVPFIHIIVFYYSHLLSA